MRAAWLRVRLSTASWVAQICSMLGLREQETGNTCFLGGSGGWKRMPPACSARSGAVTSTLQMQQTLRLHATRSMMRSSNASLVACPLH